MTTYLITRHPAVIDWLAEQDCPVDQVIAHLEPERLNPGDQVIGTLPIHLVADLSARGITYRHLVLELGPQQRGRELCVDDMRAAGARLETYSARREPGP